jgi:hypothetical protein
LPRMFSAASRGSTIGFAISRRAFTSYARTS